MDETLTLLLVRGEGQCEITLGTSFFVGRLATVHYLTPDEINAAWQVFHRLRDKNWSFTDCTSKVVMERLGCTRATAFDDHFRQFGAVFGGAVRNSLARQRWLVRPALSAAPFPARRCFFRGRGQHVIRNNCR